MITIAECGGQFSVLAGPAGLEGATHTMSHRDKVLSGPAGWRSIRSSHRRRQRTRSRAREMGFFFGDLGI
jgi:hypothetical protein